MYRKFFPNKYNTKENIIKFNAKSPIVDIKLKNGSTSCSGSYCEEIYFANKYFCLKRLTSVAFASNIKHLAKAKGGLDNH